MSRGIAATMYASARNGATAADMKEALQKKYANDPFVTVLAGGTVPATRHVRGSNNCFVNVVDDRIPGRVIILSVIDNLVKGASGQAVQNMNVACGLEEHLGLTTAPLFP